MPVIAKPSRPSRHQSAPVCTSAHQRHHSRLSHFQTPSSHLPQTASLSLSASTVTVDSSSLLSIITGACSSLLPPLPISTSRLLPFAASPSSHAQHRSYHPPVLLSSPSAHHLQHLPGRVRGCAPPDRSARPLVLNSLPSSSASFPSSPLPPPPPFDLERHAAPSLCPHSAP